MNVNGEGDLNAKVWLIGECPGKNEEMQGRPFVGGAGLILDSILQEAGINRGECYIDNVIQRRPQKNDFSIFYRDKGKRDPTEELMVARQTLQQKVQLHRPNVVVVMGNEALAAVTGKRYIMKQRGSIFSVGGVKIIPTLHPAMVMRQYEFRPVAVLDFKRVKEESLTPNMPTPYKDKFIINPSFEKVIDTLRLLHKEKRVAFDIETGQNQIICLGFGWSKEDSICIPIFYSGNSWWTYEQEVAIIREIKLLFLDGNVEFIAQNAQFDMIYLADKWGVDVKNLWMDTMIAFHCTYPEMRKGLDFLCSIYTKRPYYKDMPGSGGGPDQLWTYNCLDTVVTWEVAHELKPEMEEFGTFDFYRSHSHKLIKPLIEMQRRGVRIDMPLRQAIDKNLETELTDMQQRLNKAIGHDLNPNSPKQMKEFLYDEMKLPPQRNRKTGNLAADEDALENLAKKNPSPIFDLILDIRKVRKVLSTYIRAQLDDDGRIRCNYVITGTKTGRLSSRESVYGSGTNLQNIPRGELVKCIFVPDSGNQFINADLAQADARVVAYLAEETRLQALFERGEDIHRYNAAMVYNKKLEAVSDDERYVAKTLVHAAHYGVGARRFGKEVGCSENRARELLNQYYSLYPGIKRWHLEIEDKLKKTRTLTTPLGRKRMFFSRWSPDLVREGLAYIPQSTVNDIINLGIVRSDGHMPPGWSLCLQNHDAILFQTPIEADPMHIYKFVKYYFEIPIEINRKMVTIPVDIKVGKNWAEMKKLDIMEGENVKKV